MRLFDRSSRSLVLRVISRCHFAAGILPPIARPSKLGSAATGSARRPDTAQLLLQLLRNRAHQGNCETPRKSIAAFAAALNRAELRAAEHRAFARLSVTKTLALPVGERSTQRYTAKCRGQLDHYPGTSRRESTQTTPKLGFRNAGTICLDPLQRDRANGTRFREIEVPFGVQNLPGNCNVPKKTCCDHPPWMMITARAAFQSVPLRALTSPRSDIVLWPLRPG